MKRSEGIGRVFAAAAPSTGGTLRSLLLVATAILTAAWVAYVSQKVPLPVHPLASPLVPSMRQVATAAVAVVVGVDALILLPLLLRPNLGLAERPTPRLPWNLEPSRVGIRGYVITAAASVGLFIGAGLLGLPLWKMTLLALLAWLPAYLSEAGWQYRHYGVFALFGTITLLQLGHLSEHVTQNLQFLLTHGDAARSRGVFGQLDLEVVHFYWNVAIWIGTGLLLYRFRAGNPWLWVAFAAASLHSVEHLYIYWLYVADHAAYLAGGANGILGRGGLVGSALARPYLHLAYNMIEVVPFVLAFWVQCERIYHSGELIKESEASSAPGRSAPLSAEPR